VIDNMQILTSRRDAEGGGGDFGGGNGSRASAAPAAATGGDAFTDEGLEDEIPF
jgi:hypothetical protein